MRMARLQYEQKQVAKVPSAIGKNVHMPLVRPLFVARAAAFACACALVIAIFLSLPQRQDGINTGAFIPSVDTPVTQELAAPSLQVVREQQWRCRRLGRNTLWVDIRPDRRNNRATLYRVVLSINQDALPEGEITARIGAEVYLLPPDKFSLKDIDISNLVWTGNILKDAPVVVPVIVDEFGSTSEPINLLVRWKFRQRMFAYVIFIPSPGVSHRNLDLSMQSTTLRISGHGLYPTLRNIAQDYGVPIVANAYLEKDSSITGMGERSLEAVLRDTLDPLGLDYLYTNGVVYIDWRYEIPLQF
jgi:hypothetical protein